MLQTKLNLEMAVTDEMIDIAVAVRPAACCLVPEKREEVTYVDIVLWAKLAELAQVTARLMPAGDGAASTLPVYGGTNTAGYGSSATVLRLTRQRSFQGAL